jgi:hypothetical protein
VRSPISTKSLLEFVGRGQGPLRWDEDGNRVSSLMSLGSLSLAAMKDPVCAVKLTKRLTDLALSLKRSSAKAWRCSGAAFSVGNWPARPH